jgi:Prokaryotic E2 family D
MMLVNVVGFGGNWRTRFDRDPLELDRYRYTRHAAYFNSTGLHCGRKVRRYWLVPGLIRFSGVGDFNPQFPRRAIGKTFECTDLVFAMGGNRVLFERVATQSTSPDYYLVIVASEQFGAIDFDDPAWKSDSVLPIAISHMRERQEAMLLMKAGDWIRNTLGHWRLRVASSLRYGAALRVAPCWNTEVSRGDVCEGDMPRPAESDLTTMLEWEEGFLNSRFTHPSGIGKLTTHPGGFIGLWPNWQPATAFL